MRESIRTTGFAIYKTLAISVATVADSLVGKVTIERCDRRLHAWAEALLRSAEVHLTVVGQSQIGDRPCVFMSNHQSHFDIPIVFSVVPGTLRMVTKVELLRVPIWGRAMRLSGFVAVDRSGDRTRAAAAMREAGQAIARGTSVWLAPEGTRSPDGRLGPFKKGGFLLAAQSGVPIVPIAIDGSRAILPKKASLVRKGVHVRVTIGAPIAIGESGIRAAMEEVRAFIAGALAQPKGPRAEDGP